MTKLDPHTMCVSDVAKALDVGTDRVKQLDEVLRPVRVGASKARRYNPTAVEKYIAQRAKGR